ncbi:MAG: hypothetical protein JRI27_01820 [Deltaproteobacteria bacterium]|nr:hypothetical protein [Deltaproteobacteria bacterium]
MVKIFDRLRRLGLIYIIKDLFGKVYVPPEVDGQNNGIGGRSYERACHLLVLQKEKIFCNYSG